MDKGGILRSLDVAKSLNVEQQCSNYNVVQDKHPFTTLAFDVVGAAKLSHENPLLLVDEAGTNHTIDSLHMAQRKMMKQRGRW